MLVELKSGETLNGHLVSCDTWMNLTLKEVIQTSPSGEKFWRLPEIYVRGSTVCLYYSVPTGSLTATDQIPTGARRDRRRGEGTAG